MLKKENNTQPPKKVFILGLPNSGKSQIFNNLTGQYTIVANYSFTTVAAKKVKVTFKDTNYEIVDTPGFHSLYIQSEEELLIRDIIFEQKPDIIIFCIDSNRLKQSLVLLADIIELEIPMVILLNALDETAIKGIWIDSDALSAALGIPIIESIAIKSIGTNELIKSLKIARVGRLKLNYGDIVNQGISAIAKELPDSLRFRNKIASLMLLSDPFIDKYLTKQIDEELISKVKGIASDTIFQYERNLGIIINNKRSSWADEITYKFTKRQKIAPGQLSQQIAGVCRHPVYGVPILLGVILILYYFVVNVAGIIARFMTNVIQIPVVDYINGMGLTRFWSEFLVGNYGILTLGLMNAIITVLPILSIFFLIYHILEDIGYIPNLSILTKNILSKIGLSGATIMPLTLGFGCKTMATLTTKSIASKKEQYITIFLLAFAVPCASQMGLNMAVLGKLGLKALFTAFGFLLIVDISMGLILNLLIKTDKKGIFIQELPPIRLPGFRAVIKKTYYRLYWFLMEAVPVFIYAALTLFTFNELGILEGLKKILSPLIVGFLGLPIDMVDALILTIARQEAAAAYIIKLIEKGNITYIQTIVAICLAQMFVPCFATMVAMGKQLGTKKALLTILIINCNAFIFAGVLNALLRLIF
jgi:ferrous iron transport protein B